MPAYIRSLIFVVAALVLGSCEEIGPTTVTEGGGLDLLAAEREACERTGGTWGTRGGETLFVCFRPTRDANRSCSSASDCEGLCLARSRSCSPIKPFLGCHETLTEAGLPATVCVN